MRELAGRTYLITGASTGIGLATATSLACRGGSVYLACRSRARGEAAVSRVMAAVAAASDAEGTGGTGGGRARFLPLDLADLESVRACAREFLALGEPLHVLINNAGISGPPGTTRDGFEVVFGVNHLGHFALTMALAGRLRSAGGDGAGARVVNVASQAHFKAGGIDFGRLRRRTRGITGLGEYAVSKLCNVLFGQELARRLAGSGVTACSLHPGVVASDIWRRVPAPVRPLVTRRMLSVADGARTSLYCATVPAAELVSGAYYDNCAQKEPSRVATAELAGQLWERSEAWTRAS